MKKATLFLILQIFTISLFAQINTDRVLAIGRNALYFEDYVLSIQYFNQVIKSKPWLAEPYFYRAVAKINLDDFKGAEEDCTLCLQRNPFLTQAYYARGIARQSQEKYDEAIDDYQKGLEFKPEDRQMLTELVKLWKNGELTTDKIDRLPLELSPRRSKHAGRCCVHKERAVWKYKSLPLLGLDMDDETDELTPLSEYAARAIERANNGKPKDNIMCVIDEACSACVQINYEITDLCRGCTARSCQYNCPKGAVHVHADTGKAWIDHDTCISCGICHKSCPYHAIVYIPVPCEESCPVKAISKDEHGIEHIDENKCIYCGKCMNACPFGAIFEISQTFDVLQRIRKGEQVVAIVAPSILGQFSTTIEQVYGAFRQIGFTDIIEVAQGAMSTVEHEAHELIEKLEEGQKFMTTSCCPSYIELVNKYIPDMKKYVSGTGSPMYYAARIAKEKYPDAKIVFVGPCVAKRKEAQRDEAVDFVMTFEEISSIFDAFEINLEIVQPYAMEFSSVREAHGFAQAGGVMGAVKAFLKMEADKINAIQVSDLNKKNIGTLRAYAKSGKAPGQFIEVMACEGGCITGPSTHSGSNNGKRQLVQELAKQKKTY